VSLDHKVDFVDTYKLWVSCEVDLCIQFLILASCLICRSAFAPSDTSAWRPVPFLWALLSASKRVLAKPIQESSPSPGRVSRCYSKRKDYSKPERNSNHDVCVSLCHYQFHLIPSSQCTRPGVSWCLCLCLFINLTCTPRLEFNVSGWREPDKWYKSGLRSNRQEGPPTMLTESHTPRPRGWGSMSAVHSERHIFSQHTSNTLHHIVTHTTTLQHTATYKYLSYASLNLNMIQGSWRSFCATHRTWIAKGH